MFNPIKYIFYWIAHRLNDLNLIDADRGERAARLTWPRFLTMFARNSKRAADIAMVGLVAGPAAIAGIALATVYWGLGNGLSLGLAGGTINQVSQRFGAKKFEQLDLAVKQSVWVGLCMALPFTFAYWFFAEPLIGIFGADAETTQQGATYLSILSIAMVFNYLNTIASRTLAGADDTWIAMSVRASGAVVNIIFNAIFIFGFDMGVAGAALGTVLAEGLVTICFGLGFLQGRFPLIGSSPVRLSIGPPYFDLELTKHLLRITPPLMVRRVADSMVQFPLFAILALFGPTIVAAYEVGRRVRNLMGTPGSGFSMAASSLVGQELGRGDESEATFYARDIIRFSAAIYITTAVFVFLFAQQIAHLFVDDPTAVSETIPFIRVAAVSALGYGIDKTFTGILKAAGDNTWQMYSGLIGSYLILLPITALGVLTPLGIIALYLAMIAEKWVISVITGYRVMSGKWKEISRLYRPEASTD